MSRRVSLPGADELFRPGPAPEPVAEPADPDPSAPRRSSGRVRHDEKVTVYVTADELFDLEIARLALRRKHAVAVDRGRLVREAIAIALADLDARGADSELAVRLSGS